MNICAANELTGKKQCERTVHVPCFEHLVVKNSNGKIPPVSPEGDMAGKVFCTTGCYQNYIKANAVGYGWGNDGKNGALDCSEVLLVNRFLSDEGEFSNYRSPPNGQTKLDVCNRWANTINGCGVMKHRSGKDVQNKVTAIEAQMRLAQDFSETSTGQGLQDGSTLGSWDEAVKQKCKYWFLLQPVFGQRAGMKPMVTTEDMLKTLDDDDSDVSSVNFGNDNGGGFTSSSGFMSSDDEDSSVVEVHAHKKQKKGRNPEGEREEETKKKKTTTTTKTPKKMKKTNKKGGGSGDKKQTSAQAQRNTDEQLAILVALKVADAQYKNRMRKRELERSTRRRLEDYDLTDCEQWIEFAERFETIKATMGGCAVRTAVQFPLFAETSLLTAEEKMKVQEHRGLV